MHDTHLVEQVDAYAANDYAKAQQMQLEGYQQMLGVASTLVGAIQKTVQAQQPAGGSLTGGGGQHSRTMTRSRRGFAVGVAALALLAGCAGSDPRLADPAPATGSQRPDRTASPQRPDPAAGGLDAARGFQSVRGYRATPLPVRVQIPKIGVASPLDRLGRAQDGTVEVPSRWGMAGWYALGPRPGDSGQR